MNYKKSNTNDNLCFWHYLGIYQKIGEGALKPKTKMRVQKRHQEHNKILE